MPDADSTTLIVETTVVKHMLSRMELTHSERGIMVASGPWGIGKTTAIDEFARQHEGSCVVVKVEPGPSSGRGSSPSKIMQLAVEALRGLRGSYTSSQLGRSAWLLRQMINEQLRWHTNDDWRVGDLNAQIGELEQARSPIIQAAPHTDDIVAVLSRALRTSAEKFETQFAAFLKSTFDGSAGADKVAQGSAANLLRLPPPRNGADSFNHRQQIADAPAVDLTALTYFLRDQIEAEIPALVERLLPAARNGMTSANRAKALQELDAQISELKVKRDAVQDDLNAARAIVAPR